MTSWAQKLDAQLTAHKKELLPALLCSVCFTFLFRKYRGLSFDVDAMLVACLVTLVLAVFGFRRARRSVNVCSGILGAVLGFFVMAGRTVRTENGTPFPWNFGNVVAWVALAVCFFFGFRGACALLDKVDLQVPGEKPSKKLWLYSFLIIFILWLPMLLVMGPRLSIDSVGVVQMALGELPLNDAHPIVYTLLLRAFLMPAQALGSVTAGAYLFCLAQMAFVAGTFSYALYKMRMWGCAKWMCWLGLGWYTLTLVFSLNSITVWKDIPFNAVLMLLMLFLYEVAESGGERLATHGARIHLAVLTMAACFLRGNGFLIMCVVAAVLLVVYRKCWRQVCLALLPALLAVKLITGPVYALAGLQASPLGIVESLGVPIQQVARVVAAGGEITEEQQARLAAFVDVETQTNYSPESVDYVKGAYNKEYLNTHKGEFFALWAEIGMNSGTNLVEYLNAWLYETLGYWHLGFRSTSGVYYTSYNGTAGIQQTDVLSPLFGEDLSTFVAWAYQFVSIASMAWAVIMGVLYLCTKKCRAQRLVPLAIPLTVWVGMMIGAPTNCEFRYMLVFAYAMPFMAYMVLHKADGEESECATEKI